MDSSRRIVSVSAMDVSGRTAGMVTLVGDTGDRAAWCSTCGATIIVATTGEAVDWIEGHDHVENVAATGGTLTGGNRPPVEPAEGVHT